ncbi:MAG TPA: DUF6526 family protein [Acidobacteriaceae bacterium]|nr:DUF6526 family protein [Acidobacteriaceae bacterium]
MAQPQTFKNHMRFDPPFHFFILPVLLLNLIFSIYETIHRWPSFPHMHLWWIVMSLVLFVMAGIFRGYALKNQDRLIRLEEQLRLADLLSEDQLGLIDALTVDQFVGLRFASDAEVAALAQRAVTEHLDRKQIKQAIITWRPDNQRI